MSHPFLGVVTTIHEPTESLRQLTVRLRNADASMIVIGGHCGPASFDLDGALFISMEQQMSSPFELARLLPTRHYTRKNVGYLQAIAQGVNCVYETDDDNTPLPSWSPRREFVKAARIEGGSWVNVYRLFSGEHIWPRGFPLDEINASAQLPGPQSPLGIVRAPIQQGLINKSPDVDAIWRLIRNTPFNFDHSHSICLGREAWCPFNSQNTWWWRDAFPLLYLPSNCSFRMTDIWRSFVAQRCLWELDLGVVFHGADVEHERNSHDLMRDFGLEVPGYMRNRELVEVLAGLDLQRGVEAVAANLLHCYESLVLRDFIPEEELPLVRAWLADLNGMGAGSSGHAR